MNRAATSTLLSVSPFQFSAVGLAVVQSLSLLISSIAQLKLLRIWKISALLWLPVERAAK